MTLSRFAEELADAPTNLAVGTRLWYENDEVKVWEILLRPGERAPFHAHTRHYFWTCISPGKAIQRLPDGTETLMEYADGQTKFSALTPEDPLIHDLENVGETDLRFVTVELLPPAVRDGSTRTARY